MGELFIYSIKSALCVTAFYLIFKALLSRDTFYSFNRFVLLGSMLLSLALPFVHVHTTALDAVPVDLPHVETLAVAGDAVEAVPGAVMSLPMLLLIIYMSGVVIFSIRELRSLMSLYAIMRRGRCVDGDGGMRIHVVKETISPFSWFGNVVISEADYAESARSILIHEREHIARRHSSDIVLCDAFIIFQWYNPAAWLLKAELQAVHEYEADEAVLKSGIDASGYQLLLIRKAVGDRLFTMANNLNNNSLKKRITMMMKRKSNPWNRAKILAGVPIALLAVAAFAGETAESVAGEMRSGSDRLVSDIQVGVESFTGKAETDAAMVETTAGAGLPVSDDDDKVLRVAEKMPEFPGGLTAMTKWLGENLKYPEAAVKNKEEGRVVLQFTIRQDGSITDVKVMRSVSKALDAEAVRVVSCMPKWTPGKQGGKPVNVKYMLPVTFRLPDAAKAACAPVVGDGVVDECDELPQYPGGIPGVVAYLSKNIKYPKAAAENKIEGRVVVEFVINKDGSVSNVVVKRSVNQLLDAEAVRVISRMPKWTPGKQDGKPVNVKYTLPVIFKLS